MSVHEQFRNVFSNWDKEVFRNIHHEDFLFIRETELLTLEDHVENIDCLVTSTNFAEKQNKQAVLIHENEYVSEVRWRDGDEIVTAVVLLKNGKAWRQIANRVHVEDTLSSFLSLCQCIVLMARCTFSSGTPKKVMADYLIR